MFLIEPNSSFAATSLTAISRFFDYRHRQQWVEISPSRQAAIG